MGKLKLAIDSDWWLPLIITNDFLQLTYVDNLRRLDETSSGHKGKAVEFNILVTETFSNSVVEDSSKVLIELFKLLVKNGGSVMM